MRLVEDWTARAERLDVGGETVAVVDVPATASGGGVPLLVVHGFPTSSIDFAPMVERLAGRRRVVLMDLPGYGLSDKPDRAYSLFGQADVVEAVAASRGLDEVDLITHDMGNSVGGELLARAAEGRLGFAVRRRVITNGSIYLDLAQLTRGQRQMRSLPDVRLSDGAAPSAGRVTAGLESLCAAQPPSAEVRASLEAATELVVREGGSHLLPRLIRYIDERAVHERRWTGAIEDHPAPLTIVWGHHDPVAVAVMVGRLTSRRHDATVVWLDAGHWTMVERADEFTAAVLTATAG